MKILTKRRRILVLWFLAIVALALSYIYLFYIPTRNSASVFIRPFGSVKSWGVLSLRIEDDTGNTLLIKFQNPSTTNPYAEDTGTATEIICRYDSDREELHYVSEEIWDQAKGNIKTSKEYLPQQLPKSKGYRFDGYSFIYDNKKIATTAKTTLGINVSCKGRYVAAWSATGTKSKNDLLFGGYAGSSGRHYHQTFSLADGKFIGKPVYIGIGSRAETIKGCWSADERYIVYYSDGFYDLAVIDLHKFGGQ